MIPTTMRARVQSYVCVFVGIHLTCVTAIIVIRHVRRVSA